MINQIYPLLLFLAEQSEKKSFFTDPDIWRPVNAIIFLLILIYLLRNKIGIGRVFDERAAGIQKELDSARKEKEEATTRLSEMEARLKRLDQEAAQIREDAQREAEKEAARIRDTAAADAEKIAQMTKREIEGAVRTAQADLRAFVAEHAVGLAESIIRREMKPDDDRRIIVDYVDELKEAGK